MAIVRGPGGLPGPSRSVTGLGAEARRLANPQKQTSSPVTWKGPGAFFVSPRSNLDLPRTDDSGSPPGPGGRVTVIVVMKSDATAEQVDHMVATSRPWGCR